MPNPGDMFPRDDSQPTAVFARIAEDAASEASRVRIIIPNFSPTQYFGPCRWSARGDLLPSEGDHALAVIDDTGEYWVAVWWPYA